MKKFLPHLIVILVLGGIAAFYWWNEDESTINKREAAFKIANAASITKIVLNDEQKHTITLEKKKNGWMVNNRFNARPDLIETLLNILSKQESQAPVGKAAYENVLREMLAKSIQVQVFTGGTSPKKIFYVGGSTLDGQGTYMILDVNGKLASRPHIVRVPGIRGYLTPAFEMKEETWRDRKIFGTSPQNIASISIQYPASPMQSFSIAAVADSFVLYNANGETEATNQSLLYSYCAMYESIYFEAFDNENQERESTLKETPFSILTLKDKTGNTSEVKLYYMPINRRSKRLFDEHGNDILADVDRFFALANGKDFAIAQVYVFGKLLRKYQDFFPPQK